MVDLTKLYKNQISLTEWFEKAGHKNSDEMRLEDNEKRERLRILNEIINIPFDKPVQFKAIDISNESEQFKKFLSKHSAELCALRLIPLDKDLPKLRTRGLTIGDAIKWFSEQKINPEKYKADFVPHSEKQLWSTIFVVNVKGIFGEIISGGHHQLTQGFYDSGKPIMFSYNFKNLTLNPKNNLAELEIFSIIKKLKVEDISKQNILKKELNSEFSQDFLKGYFETVTTEDQGLWFVDYNRLLGKLYDDYHIDSSPEIKREDTIKGFTGSIGKFTGKAKIVSKDNLNTAILTKGDILVCEMTTPEYLFLMKDAGAIITDLGGVLSHAAIIAREFKIPCLTGTEVATQKFKDGDLIEVNASDGYSRKLS